MYRLLDAPRGVKGHHVFGVGGGSVLDLRICARTDANQREPAGLRRKVFVRDSRARKIGAGVHLLGGAECAREIGRVLVRVGA